MRPVVDFFNMGSAVLILVAIIQSYSDAYTIEKWNMHESCGAEIARFNKAGELHFNADSLPSYLPGNECKVTIFPEQTQDSNSLVLFYFTEFALGSYCEDTNMTILDGGRYLDKAVHIQGLPTALCGSNATLVRADQVFTTTQRQLTVIFRRSDSGRRFSGKFIIKFVSFHEGTCAQTGSGDDSLVTCSNGRCIDLELHCVDGLNSCGGGENEICVARDTVFNILDYIKEIAETIGIIIAIAIGYYFLQYVYKHMRSIHGSIRNFPILRNFFNNSDASASEPPYTNSGDGVAMARQDNVELDQISVSSQDQATPQTGFLEPGSQYESVLPPLPPIPPNSDYYPQPSAPPGGGVYYPPPSTLPPPSYDEVVSNETKYQSKSSDR